MINGRTKGHTWERKVVNDLKKIGYKWARTSRTASKDLDNCKIDIAHVPFNIQCKSGLANARPRYDRLYKECIELVKKWFPPKRQKEILSNPYILMYKLDQRKKENCQMVVDYEFGLHLLSLHKKYMDER